jgi:hypothetical protein
LTTAGFLKGVLATSLVVLGFCSANAVANRFLEQRDELRLPLGSSEREKLAEYGAHADEYDAVFIGTSHILRGVDPRVFDQRMAELEQPLRSYNFGLNGMGFLEQLHLVKWILAQRSRRLRFLFIEPTERDAVMRIESADAHKVNLFTMRSVYWHGLEESILGVRATWSSPRRVANKIELTRLHLLHLAHRMVNVGVGVNLVNLYLLGSRGEALEAGFAPRDPEGAEWEQVEGQPHREGPAREPPAQVTAIMVELVERARSAGVRPVLLIPPTPQPSALSRFLDAHPDAQQWKAPADLLHYSSVTFPEIHADQNAYFYDEGHMNLRGAALFTRRLADDFAALLRKP